MLDFTRTRIVESNVFKVQDGYTITAEGMPLVGDYTGGIFGVRESAGAAAEKFLGVSMSQQMTLLSIPRIQTITVPAGSTPIVVNLDREPLGGSLFVYDETSGVAITAGSSANATEYSITDKAVSLNTARGGHVLRFQYRYSPTTIEARTIQGDIPPGGAADLTLGTMGTIVKGVVATTMFDTSVDWNVANPVLTVGTSGLFTLGGLTPVPGAVILGLPASGSVSDLSAVLVIELS